MPRATTRMTLLGAFLAVPASGFAIPMTIDFSGTIALYETFDDSADPVDQLGTLSDLRAHGSITYDLDLAPAATSEIFGDSYTYRRRSVGEPLADFVSGSLTWEKGTFGVGGPPAPAGATVGGDEYFLRNRGATVVPDPGVDDFTVVDRYVWGTESASWISTLALVIRDDFLVEGAGVPAGHELPDFTSFLTGRAIFGELRGRGADGGEFFDGYQLAVELDSVALRAVRVSEPGTAGLLLGGILASGFAQRRRLSALRR